MTIRDADQTVISKTQLLALTTTVVDPPAILTVIERIYQDYNPRAGDENPDSDFEPAQKLLYVPGQRITAAEIDALFVAATATAIAPATGAAAGGTPVQITGTNFAGTTGVTFGGVAATAVLVVNNETITCVTPVHAAGAVTVVIADDSGALSKPAFFTYV